jgi:hypothetical protein
MFGKGGLEKVSGFHAGSGLDPAVCSFLKARQHNYVTPSVQAPLMPKKSYQPPSIVCFISRYRKGNRRTLRANYDRRTF